MSQMLIFGLINSGRWQSHVRMRPAHRMAWGREKQGMEEKGDTVPKRIGALFLEESRSLVD